jgi:hypothetical protein
VLFQEVQRVGLVLRRIHLVTTRREGVSGYGANMWVIIHNQDTRHVRARAEVRI